MRSTRHLTPRPPRATYRLQLHAEFGFDAAAAIADYLQALGVSHVYSSPYLQAAPGSRHGYDVIDHHRVNVELGGTEAHQRFCTTLGEHELGQVLDVVPNHMAILTPGNRWWWDVLENGPASAHAAYFDVDWDPPEQRLRNVVMLPVLGDHFGRVLEAGELRLERSGTSFTVRYHEHMVPVAPRSLSMLLMPAAVRAGSDALAFIADAFESLPHSMLLDRASLRRRNRDKEVLRAELGRLLAERAEVAAAVDAVVAEVNADADRFEALLDRQNHRLAFWRTAQRDLGYRRFFDINSLVGLRVEDEAVLADTHGLIWHWVDQGLLDGLRVDHPDGLRDPASYLQRMVEQAPKAWIVVEKILGPGERLPESWPVAGTTGYEFLNLLGGVFVDRSAEPAFSEFYGGFTGERRPWAEVVADKKRQVLREILRSDVNRLTNRLVEICERHRRYRDYTRPELRMALAEVLVTLPVYRTYVQAETGEVRAEDAAIIEAAAATAKQRNPDVDPLLFDFVRDLWLLRVRGPQETELVMRLQQLGSSVAAKGVEDTAFYSYHRLVCLNEVGGDPGRFGVSLDELHAALAEAQEHRPHAMLATSTHDTKRSEDVRLRIAMLSELPGPWFEAVERWSNHNLRYRRGELPERNTEYLYYQTLVGAWPLGPERAAAYMLKAAREAKVHTSWTAPRADYEDALAAFVAASLADGWLRGELERFVAGLAGPAQVSSLAQVLVKLTAPGVPDLYQGSELWDLSLVDPDNRRPVDFALRRRLLAEARDLDAPAVSGRAAEGLPKLWVTQRALGLRRERPHAFGADAGYQPLRARGPRADHVLAFARGGEIVTVVPRLVWTLAEGGAGLGGARRERSPAAPAATGVPAARWGDTTLELPPGRWHDVLGRAEVRGGPVRLDALLARFPVALLARVR